MSFFKWVLLWVGGFLATLAPAQTPEVTSLDPLLQFNSIWQTTVPMFEAKYRVHTDTPQEQPPQFEWLSASKDRARFSRQMFTNIETKLGLFGGAIQVEEAIVEFVQGRVARATISFYNRGDSGKIDLGRFDALHKMIGRYLGPLMKVAPRQQIVSGNAATKVIGWRWDTPKGIALLEHNDYSVTYQPEFLRLKIAAPSQADWSMGKLSVGVQRMALLKNVQKTAEGDVFIANVPMVDQGAKGYCVAASCQRLFEYMQIPCDQHEMAQLLNVDVESGANVRYMQKSLAKVDGRFNVTFKPLVNPEKYYDTKGNPRVSMREFIVLIKEHADKGVPLLWGLEIGQYPEMPALPSGGQVSGGHMRMVIGYNTAKQEILFTDSWGAGHELKRMNVEHAFQATLGLYSMSPRGL